MLLVVDEAAGLVRMYEPSTGAYQGSSTVQGAPGVILDSPTHLLVVGSNTVYVSFASCIYKGTLEVASGSKPSLCLAPFFDLGSGAVAGMAVDSYGNFYIANRTGNEIVAYSSSDWNNPLWTTSGFTDSPEFLLYVPASSLRRPEPRGARRERGSFRPSGIQVTCMMRETADLRGGRAIAATAARPVDHVFCPDPMNEHRSLETRVRSSIVVLLIAFGPARAADAADLAGRAQAFLCRTIVSSATTRIRRKAASISSALPWKPNDVRTFDQWVEVFDKVDKQKMPPASRKRPDPAARAEFLEALRTELRTANLAKQQTEGRVVLRRLNRVEYENTLHDLLAIDVPLQHYLPEDATTNGFDNVAAGLRLSMLHMEQYLEAADAAISAAMEFRRRPEVIHKRLRYHDEESVQDDVKKKEKKTFRVLPDAVVIFDDNSPTVLRRWIVPARGRYRIRISGRAYQAAGRPVWLKLYATDFKTQRLLAYFDLPADTAAHDGSGRHISKRANYSISVRSTPTTTIKAGEAASGESAPKRIPAEGSPSSGSRSKAPWSTAGRRRSVGRLFGDLPVKPVEPARKAESGRRAPSYAIAPGDPRSAAETVLAGIRVPRVPAPGHVGRRRALCQAGAPGARRRPDLRGRDARGLPRRDHVAQVPVSR